MKPKLILCLALVLSGGLFGCSTLHSPVASTGIKNCINKFQMIDADNGWIWADDTNGFHLLHTTNGGQAWADVTPQSFTNRVWDCQFPKPQLAWISFYENNKTRLLLTTNAGKSWVAWSPLGDFPDDEHNFFLVTRDGRFINDKDGLTVDINVGLCQATYDFFETHDGGLNWKPASIVQEGSNEPSSTIQIGDCDGSAVNYYPPKTIVIANGDLADETPKGIVRFSVSTDAGKSWRGLTLPVPEKYRDGLVDSFSPYFFDDKSAVFPVRVCKLETNTDFVFDTLVFYRTEDGGNTWSRAPGALDFPGRYDVSDTDFVSPNIFFVRHGADLYVTHDGAKTWQAIKSNVDFQDVTEMEFLDATHGWIVNSKRDGIWSPDHGDFYSFTTLYKTSDGGKTWTEIPLKILHEP